jgi:hypothetical protein
MAVARPHPDAPPKGQISSESFQSPTLHLWVREPDQNRLERVPIKWNHLIGKDAAQTHGVGACLHRKGRDFLRTCASGMAVADIAAEPKQPKPMPAAKTNVKLVFMA